MYDFFTAYVVEFFSYSSSSAFSMIYMPLILVLLN